MPSLLLSIALVLSASLSMAVAAEPTVQNLRAAFPGRPMREVDEVSFRRFVAMHASEGRLLTGTALAATVASTAPVSSASSASPDEERLPKASSATTSMLSETPPGTSAGDPAPDSLPAACRSLPPERRSACVDSLRRLHDQERLRSSIRDTHDSDMHEAGARADHTETRERARGYFSNFLLDSNGNWDMDGKEWAAVLYVVVGVVVVGAFIVYGAEALVELATNQDDDPVFREIGLRYSYSGRQWSDGGPPLYRDANLIGLRFGIGLDRGAGMGLGVAVEGGYIDLSLRAVDDPTKVFDFQGGYLVAGPMLRFGRNDPLSLTLEFLNGASDHASIGWISKSRMTVQGKVGKTGLLVGAHIGAVFYDLSFYDGLAQRQGNFNRDLSLVIGADTGWEF